MHACDANMNAGRRKWFDWNEEQQRDTPNSFEKKCSDFTGGNVVLLGKMIVTIA